MNVYELMYTLRAQHIASSSRLASAEVHAFYECSLVVVVVVVVVVVYTTADDGDAYMFYRCFLFFLPFPFATKIPDNRSRKRLNGQTDSGENGVCIAVPKWGLGPRLIFLGAKNYTLRTWW